MSQFDVLMNQLPPGPEMVQEIARLQEQNARLVQDSQRYLAEIARLLSKCRDLELTLEISAENSGVWPV